MHMANRGGAKRTSSPEERFPLLKVGEGGGSRAVDEGSGLGGSTARWGFVLWESRCLPWAGAEWVETEG